MQIAGAQFSNIPEHWNAQETGIDGMTQCDHVVVQAEMFHETKFSKSGNPFADGESAFDWFSKYSEATLWAYFDPFKVNKYEYGAAVDRVRDPYWLRRKLQQKLYANEHWYWTDNFDRMITKPSNRWFCDWLVGLLLDTKIPRFYLDDATLTDKSDADKDGVYYICNDLIAEGVEIIANGGWQIQHPNAQQWTYYMLENVPGLSGAVVEYWTSEYTGQQNPDDNYIWWVLDEERMQRLAADWKRAGKDLFLGCRYRPGETDHADYKSFAKAFGDYSNAIGTILMPSNENYYSFTWLDGFATRWPDGTPVQSLDDYIVEQCDERQQVSLNSNASLLKAILYDGAVPVQNEFEIIYDGQRYMVQKAERPTTRERYYYRCPYGDWHNITRITRNGDD